jgi:uncharacterized membrane protein
MLPTFPTLAGVKQLLAIPVVLLGVAVLINSTRRRRRRRPCSLALHFGAASPLVLLLIIVISVLPPVGEEVCVHVAGAGVLIFFLTVSTSKVSFVRQLPREGSPAG